MVIQQFISSFGDVCRRVQFKNKVVLISASTIAEARLATREWLAEVSK